jgi:hypothetical protein
MSEMVERVALAIREELVRQYRDDERHKCPAGPAYYEEAISPTLIANVAIAAMREPTEAMVKAGNTAIRHRIELGLHTESDSAWRAMIDATLAD